MSSADLILCVLDGSEKMKKDDIELLNKVKGRCAIIVVNKRDLKPVLDTKKAKRISGNKDIIRISCLDKEGIDRLEDKVYNNIWSGAAYSSHQLLLNNVRHKDAINRAIAALLAAENATRRKFSPEFLATDVREGIDALGEITGQTYTDDILDVIFSKFCIGK